MYYGGVADLKTRVGAQLFMGTVRRAKSVAGIVVRSAVASGEVEGD